MIIYIEYVLIENFIIDFLLLKATTKISKTKAKKIRIIISSIFGAVFSLIFPLIKVNQIVVILLKGLFGMILTLWLYKWNSKRQFFFSLGIFLCLTFISGGLIYSVKKYLISNELIILFSILSVYIITIIVKKIVNNVYKKKNVSSFIFDIEVGVGKTKINATGFLDSGNGVYDKNHPVIFCGVNVFKKLLNNSSVKTLKKISFFSVIGSDEKSAIVVDYVKIYFNGQANIIKDVRVCAIKKSIFCDCEFLLHPALLNMENKEMENETA
ncbi:MAG: sigma-E processing peptidase SpoIIGA [Clostridia bacterium]|nr:sigma-E processing peptidase SpoIIGA [Clostridia bacterium]